MGRSAAVSDRVRTIVSGLARVETWRMDRRPTTRAAHAAIVLIALGAWLLLAFVVRALGFTGLASGSMAWVVPVLSVATAVAAAGAMLGCLVRGLRSGSLATLIRTGAMGGLLGGCLGLATGTPTLSLAAAGLGAFTLAAATADRFGTIVNGRGPRLAIAATGVLIGGALAVVEIAPSVRPILAGLGPGLLVGGAMLAAVAILVAAGRELALVAATTLGATVSLWLAHGPDPNLVLALVALLGAALMTAHAMLDPGTPASSVEAVTLPDLANHVADGILIFDGRLQLRSWNTAAERLLVLDQASAGSRLEDLLGVSLAQLPSAGDSHHVQTAGGLEAALHRWADGVTVIVRDPKASQDASRLGRELRGTIEELHQARRTIDLQRAELERAATLDPLTGVPSREAILARLGLEVAAARRYQHPVAVVLIDIDGFTDLNARHGIDGGDAVLREVALRMKLRVREADALGRVGSDRFLAVLPHTDDVGAATFADALRRRIGQRPMLTGQGDASVTVSAGVAVIRAGEDLQRDGLLARADEALSSAREAGGDRVALDRLHGLARLSPRDPGPDHTETDADDVGL